MGLVVLRFCNKGKNFSSSPAYLQPMTGAQKPDLDLIPARRCKLFQKQDAMVITPYLLCCILLFTKHFYMLLHLVFRITLSYEKNVFALKLLSHFADKKAKLREIVWLAQGSISGRQQSQNSIQVFQPPAWQSHPCLYLPFNGFP